MRKDDDNAMVALSSDGEKVLAGILPGRIAPTGENTVRLLHLGFFAG